VRLATDRAAAVSRGRALGPTLDDRQLRLDLHIDAAAPDRDLPALRGRERPAALLLARARLARHQPDVRRHLARARHRAGWARDRSSIDIGRAARPEACRASLARTMLNLSYAPGPPLADFVDRVWMFGDAPLHARERVLPSGTLELVINLHLGKALI
jgi:Domain of unknown function (DUF6597)